MAQILNDVPDILYKYRDWNNSNHKKLLENRELYFASIDQFNDPFDGTIPFRYDAKELTEDNIFEKYRQITKREYPNWTEEQIHKHCFDYQQRGHFHDEKFLEDFEADTSEQTNNNYGIVCLCKEKNNFLLWSHYANSHTGFCIGFNKLLLYEDTEAQFAHMNYQENLPTLNLFDNPFEVSRKLIGTKSKIWEYENEYRLTKISSARKVVFLRKETIVEIILGYKMSQQEKFKLLKFIGKEYPHANVYDMKPSKTKFEMEIMQIR